MHHRSRAALTAASVAMLVVPAGASAATKTVDMGTPASIAKSLQRQNVDVNAFFPARTTIHVGDSVKFVPVNFHTVDFPKKGGKPLGLLQQAGTVSGANDAAGQPFWFNGKPAIGFDAALLKFGFGKKLTYNGTKGVSSGLPVSNKPKAMTVKFTKAGTYTYFCSVHPGMKGSVKVVTAGRRVPSAKADASRVARQVAAAKKGAKALAQTKAPANSVIVAPVGKSGLEYFGFAPGNLTVPAGTTVTFSMPASTFDEHTVTFGPGNPEQPSNYLGNLSATFNGPGPFNPQAIYPSDPPGTTATLSPALHGNGFWNAGVLYGAQAKLSAFPTSGKVTFSTPGTYNYYCLIHPFMKGTVTVK
ncbi:MAG: cupredoxin domain-containing protein [Solirubrobacteraceae bacterium]